MHWVCSRIGNRPEVAAEHSLTTSELDFTQAVTVIASCSAQFIKSQQSAAEMARTCKQQPLNFRRKRGVAKPCKLTSSPPRIRTWTNCSRGNCATVTPAGSNTERENMKLAAWRQGVIFLRECSARFPRRSCPPFGLRPVTNNAEPKVSFLRASIFSSQLLYSSCGPE